ncbi:UNVERIFIED_CONTAM: Retrovirus-related Pol polyprotein from transposon [Sesamum radiatum]|uniref:Retrovirus-related Pol polyprotein from transposon n=1 Tax=Sesamum radiatum TaxID=300843 RepID=A0AAW2JFV1_SESRA
MVTRYGAFEFLIMPFGLTNAPATFSTLMNQVLHGFLDEFMVVYLDDIVIYSRTLAEHVENLQQVLTRLHEHELYAKVSKCSFAQETISFLGHIVERGCIRMDPRKCMLLRSGSHRAMCMTCTHFSSWRIISAFCERLLRDSTAHDGLTEEDVDLELDTQMPSIFQQLEESDGDMSCVGLTRYVESICGGDRHFRLRIRMRPNERRPPSCL